MLNKARKHANKHVGGHQKGSPFEITGVSKRTLKAAWVLSRLCYLGCFGGGGEGKGFLLMIPIGEN